MSYCESHRRRERGTRVARTRVATALALLELAGEVLESLPRPQMALQAKDPELFRDLRAAEVALRWIVGKEEEDSIELPGPSSALGESLRVFTWTEEETIRHFHQESREDVEVEV